MEVPTESASAIYCTGTSAPGSWNTPETGRATHASFTKGTTVHQKIDSVRPTNSAVLEHQLPASGQSWTSSDAAGSTSSTSLRWTQRRRSRPETGAGSRSPEFSRQRRSRPWARSKPQWSDVNGYYGTCEHCTEPIPFERLEVLPMSRLCTPCQHLTESGRSRTWRPSNTLSVSRIR